ncbi:MAG TPA: type IV secretory system conjugative DNA transfer family protein [Gemmataceae bacterium]|nr:type IV secretory system conjugative DNA transfer family protein [Gemmataceae bacterium]
MFYRFIRFLLILTVVGGIYCLCAAAMRWTACAVVLVVILAWVSAKRGYLWTAFGTSRWAGVGDLARKGMIGGTTGLAIGHLDEGSQVSRVEVARALFDPGIDSRTACRDFLEYRRGKQKKGDVVRLARSVHTAVFAPTGVGKGINFVLPFLLSCKDSAIVIDFKGENARLTVTQRKQFGHRCVLLDPFNVVTQTPDCLNVLDGIDGDSQTAMDEVRDLANAMVIRTGQEKEPHWNDMAEALICGMIAVTVCYGPAGERSLQTVREFVADTEKFKKAVELMCASDKWDGLLKRLGNQLKQIQDKELNSTLTTANRHLRFLDTIAVARSTKVSSFEPSDIIKGQMSAFLILPPDHMRAQSSLLRLWITAFMRASVKGGLQQANTVHYVLDEAASLGHLEVIDDAVDKFRGYSVKLQFYYQSMSQLKKAFPEEQDQTLLSNCTTVFFGTNDLPTAEHISKRCGEQTIIVDSGGTSEGKSYQGSNQGQESVGTSTNRNANWQQHGRSLLKPEEVLTLPERTAITFMQGMPPIRTTLVPYYESAATSRLTLWEAFTTGAKSLFFSICLFLSALLLGFMVTVIPGNRRGPIEAPGMINPPSPQQPVEERKAKDDR